MTDKADNSRVEIEQLLKRVRPAEPSDHLQEQVVAAARQAWQETATDTPWRVALGRLAGAAVAAAVVVSCANYLSNRTLAPWRPQEFATAHAAGGDVEEFPEVSFGPLLRHVAALHGGAGRDASGALAYRERLQEMLDEPEHSIPADAPAPVKGRSRLPPVRPGHFYS